MSVSQNISGKQLDFYFLKLLNCCNQIHEYTFEVEGTDWSESDNVARYKMIINADGLYYASNPPKVIFIDSNQIQYEMTVEFNPGNGETCQIIVYSNQAMTGTILVRNCGTMSCLNDTSRLSPPILELVGDELHMLDITSTDDRATSYILNEGNDKIDEDNF